MSCTISKIRLINYKRFTDYTIEPNSRINILVGDNEAGKSSILEAIDLVASGNPKKIEAIGIDRLLNIDAVNVFFKGAKTFDNLPKIIIELYLNGEFDHTMNGKNNTDRKICDGIRLICEPNPDYRTEITQSLNCTGNYFPYDYYSFRFSTFADEGYTGYKKKLRCFLIDSANMNSEYATNEFVRRMYLHCTENNLSERISHKSNYRKLRNHYNGKILKNLNEHLYEDKKYEFALRGGNSINIENDLMILEDEIEINCKGTGKQVFIKTDFALNRAGDNVDIVLIEEPENHLSHVNLRKLIQKILDTRGGQLFITTHNSLISTRLELNNLIILHDKEENKPVMLKNLNDNTANYFMKAPPACIVEFTLSPKTILVEGPSEFTLFEKFYQAVTEHMPEYDNVHIIDVRGLSFKRYLEIAKLTGSKVAVVTDNDKNYQNNILNRYKEFSNHESIGIFSDPNNSNRTFEVVLFNDNKDLCTKLFGMNAQEYMLNHKTDAAFILLTQSEPITVPDYIRSAISWIRK